MLEVTDDEARYWNKMAPARRDELWKQARKEGKDVRELVAAFVYKPGHVK